MRYGWGALLLCGSVGCKASSVTPTSSDPPTDEDTDTDGPVDTDPPVDTDGPAVNDLLSTCETTLVLDAGTLCVLRPSAFDPATRDIFGDATLPDSLLGFGYHVVAVPSHPDPTKVLWVHFSGTYGRPYDPATGEAATREWLNELMEQGYTVIQPAYANRRAVNDDCAATAPGADRDDCAGEIREEVLTGIDHSPYREVAAADALDHRLRLLLEHVEAHSPLLPDALDPGAVDWSQVRVSGHSQGGNLAYYIARFRGVRYACMLGSPYDVADTVDRTFPFIADWFKRGTPLTDVPNLGQFITMEDENYGPFRGAAAYLGLTVGLDAFEISDPPYATAAGEELNGHAASVADPDLASYRAQACFR